jgi:hypothetical protein
MNVDSKIMRLKEATGLSVAHGAYDGTADKYIVFTLEDERPDLYGDDDYITETATFQIQLVVPYAFNFHTLKDTIITTMKGEGFIYQNFREQVNTDPATSAPYNRQLIFSFEITQEV